MAGSLVAAGSATGAAPVLDPEFIIDPYTNEKCPVTKVLAMAYTTKDGNYPKGTRLKNVIADCEKQSARERYYFEVRVPNGGYPPIILSLGDPQIFGLYWGTALAPDPFVVGVFESDATPQKPYHAFRYNLDTEAFQDLGTLGGPTGSSTATGVNFDGSVVVGSSVLTTATDSVYQAFRWTPALGMKKLGAISPNGFSEAWATNHEGTVVVGGTHVPGPNPGDYDQYHAFRWVLNNAATGAGTFTDLGAGTYQATAVSDDGAVVVGILQGLKAFRWTQVGGVVGLGTLPGRPYSYPTAISADGQVVVGIASASPDIFSPGFGGRGPKFYNATARAFRWTQATGMIDLNALVVAAGDDLTGITLLAALGLTADGKTISGAAIRDGEDDTVGFSIDYVVPVSAIATVVANPYGPLAVDGAVLAGTKIHSFEKAPTIKLGSTPGAANSFAQIDFEGLDIAADVVLSIRSGAPNQTIVLRNAGPSPAVVAGSVRGIGGNGANPPKLYVESAPGVTTEVGSVVESPSGLTVDTLGATVNVGGVVTNAGTLDGGPSLAVLGGRITGGGPFKGDALLLSTFGNANNPVNGSRFLANGLQLFPGTGTSVALTLNDYGASPQFLNLKINGDASIAMPSAWPAGSFLPPNNAPLPLGGTRAPGVGEPAFGGGSMIIQATGNMTVAGGTGGDFVFSGAIALIATDTLNLNGTLINQGWTTTGKTFQGVFFESPNIVSPAGNIRVLANNLNWINFSTLPHAPVRTWALAPQPNGSAAYVTADGTLPHLNTYSVVSEAAANGECWICLINTQSVNMYGP